MASTPSGKGRPPGGNRVNLTEGPILSRLLTLAWPVVLSYGFQTLYNVADTFWLGRIGEEAVAAITFGFPVVFLFISLGGGITIAGTTLVAQHIGAGQDDKADHVASQILVFVGTLSLFLAAAGWFAAEPVVRLLGAEPEVLPRAVAYLKTWFVGVPFVFGFFIFQSLIRGSGDTVNPMKLMIASTVINIVLDPFIIFGWGVFPALGVQGAAVATVFSRGLASIVGLYLLFRGTLGLQVRVEEMVPDFKTIRKVVVIGVPAAAEMSMRAVGITAMTGIVGMFGTSVVSAYGVGSRVASVMFLPSLGFGQATTAMVGQNLGADRSDRAESTGWQSAGIMFVVLSLLGVLAFIWPEWIAGVFIRESDQRALLLAGEYIHIIALTFGLIGVQNVLNGAFRGAGRTVTAMIFSALTLVGLRAPLAYILSQPVGMGPEGLWWGVAIANIVGGVLPAVWFSFGYWKQRVIDDDETGPPQPTPIPQPSEAD